MLVAPGVQVAQAAATDHDRVAPGPACSPNLGRANNARQLIG